MADPYDTDMADRAVTLPLRQVLASLHYAYPTAIFLYYMVTSTIAVCTLQTKSSEQNHPRRRAISWLLMFIILTYFTQLLTLVARGIIQHVFPPADQDIIIGLLSCTLVFGVVFVGLSEAASPVWHPYVGSLGLALVFEPAIQALALAVRPAEPLAYTDLVDISSAAARYLAVILAVAFYLEGKCSWRREKCTDSERQSLLKTNGNAGHHDTDSEDSSDGGQPNGYGATSDVSTDASQSSDTDGDESPWERRERQASEQMEKRLKEKGNWVTYAKSFMVRAIAPDLGCQNVANQYPSRSSSPISGPLAAGRSRSASCSLGSACSP